MNESERAIQQLVYGVLELAEATRMTAAEGGAQDLARLEGLAGKADLVARQVAWLRVQIQTETERREPPAPLPRAEEPAPLPRAEEIVESLDDIFGGL